MNFSLKAKPLSFNAGPVDIVMRIVFLSVFLVTAYLGFGQVERPVRTPARLRVRQDSIQKAPINPADTVKTQTDTLKNNQPKSEIETTITYAARDSINSNLQKKVIKLYGDAHVKYGQIELQAEEIVIDYENSTITAHSRADSTGKHIGYPIFIDGGTKYETKDMMYNFKTRKAKITGVVTQQGEGFLHGDVVYKNEKDELFTIGNAYTTCDLAHPHFRIISKKVKAIPGDKMVSGPFYMEFNDVPTPLGFAFGIFPAPRKSASGILIPSYGEERRRGFFLRQGGYFFDVSEYLKVALTGDVYSKGGSAVTLNTNYNKRYYYSGAFNFTFTNNVNNEQIEAPVKSKDFRISWSHSPQTKGTGRFSASVNAASSSYNTNNFLGVNSNSQSTRIDQTTQNLSSNINYSKSFSGTPISLGINLRHNQNLSTKQVDLPLPDMSFNVNNIYPFKNAQNSMLLQNLNLRYTMNGTNQLTNNLGKIRLDENGILQDSIVPFTFDNLPLFFKNSKKGIRHSIPISTSFKAFKFFTLSPSLSYEERWYFDKLDWTYIDSTRTFVSTKVQGFNRVYNYSGGVNMTTRLYGIYTSRNPNARIKAIRHVINPSVGYSLQPDFSTNSYDYYQRFVTTDGAGNETVQYKARHEGYLYGTAGQGKSSAMSFGINNNVEMKVRNPKDTVDRKIALFNTLSIASSYNFLAESFKLANLSLSANTNILQDKINLNFSATLDPYQYRMIVTDYALDGCLECIVDRDEYEGDPALLVPIYTEKRVDAYVWKAGQAGRITHANFAFSTNLNPKGQKSDNSTRDRIGKSELSDSDKKFLLQNPDAYVDFSIPWNLRISYNIDYRHNANQSPSITQTVRFSGDVSLTDKWKITYNSGYDFENNEFTQTQIGINRDLHCWQMNLGWTPFGRYQSYNFSIGIKSSLLRDLKLDRQRSFFDN